MRIDHERTAAAMAELLNATKPVHMDMHTGAAMLHLAVHNLIELGVPPDVVASITDALCLGIGKDKRIAVLDHGGGEYQLSVMAR